MDIDLVYLWVDGNDPVWLTKKNEFLPADRQVDPQVAGECRYVENDELRYSLRSVEKFAPWIRRVYIVTDDQTPAWLDTSNPRIRVVSHREIMPAEILPVFNSCTIELFLPRIPGLAEHFLYANDDMFFSRPVDPGFFFDAAGRPVQKFKGFLTIHCHSSFPANDQPYSNRTPGKKQDDLQMERELVYWEKKGGIVTCQCQPRRPGGRPWPRRWRRPWGCFRRMRRCS